MNASRRAARRLGISETKFEAELAKEINEFLNAIEVTRLRKAESSESGEESDPSTKTSTPLRHITEPPSNEQLKGQTDYVRPFPWAPPSSRPKTKCHFGPSTKRGRERKRTLPPRRAHSPSPPLVHTPVPSEADGVVAAPLLGRTGYGQPPVDRIHTPLGNERIWFGQDQQREDTQVTLPAKTTFIHFSPARRSPFAHYPGTPLATTRPPPFRSAPERLGLSDSKFDALLTQEIDEVLLASEEERRQSRLPPREEPSPSEPSQALPILSKDDCLAFFRLHGHPTSGSLLGVWRWAANLDIPKFNFEREMDWNDLSFLNAYD